MWSVSRCGNGSGWGGVEVTDEGWGGGGGGGGEIEERQRTSENGE